MKVFISPITGYTSELDWNYKINYKTNNDIAHISRYFNIFHITNIKTFSKIYNDSSCIITYILNLNYNKFQTIDIHNYTCNIEILKNYFIINWSSVKYILEEQFDTITQIGLTSVKFTCSLYNIDELDINNVFELED